MLALPGSAYLYQGEELGLEEVEDLPDEARQDPTWERSGRTVRGRDGCRVPIPWEGERPPFGFGAEPSWLPVPERWADRTVQAQSQDASSTLRLYRAALRLRREFRGARILSWREAPAGVLAFGVDTGLACTANMSEKPVRIQAPGTLLLASQEVALDGASAVLPPRSAAWWREYSNRVGATIHSEGP
jgi:alpha-glucosidase